ncbi:hypothetical protein [Nonomuraea jiangxiensis]|uniref:Uncharacterized protein n=1 Tax=Nonomuraea jiangxiensis TaxID=633440 RepID=A0A1G8TDJ6_9ACTN|nr:hypothetical protein [Nonomuraea jiangxiensis]SDJ39682.1 hypothetical protein SAMN05421869_110154 [Nonomuraea jiangxiensis]
MSTTAYAKVDQHALRVRAEEYLAMRRALGFKLTTQGRYVMSFVRFCEERGRVTARRFGLHQGADARHLDGTIEPGQMFDATTDAMSRDRPSR